MLPLAQATVEAGHEVAFATAADFCPRIEQAGFSTFPAGLSLSAQLDEAGRRYPEANLPPGKHRFETFVPQMLAGVAAPPRMAELAPVIDEWQPHLLVHDETELAGPLAAAHAGVPWADHSVGILRPLAMAELAGRTLAPLAEQWGVDLGRFAGLFRYLYLDVCPPRLQRDEIGQIRVSHALRNLGTETGPTDTLPPVLASLPSQPTVYVSLGTIFNRASDLFRIILEGMVGEPVNVVVTVGPDNDPAALGPQPDNVRVERYVPQALLLPHCHAVVNQGGTAILDILGAGLPILVLPQGANQFHNAEALVNSGVARALLPGEVTPAAVRDGLHALLSETRHRQAASAIAAELAAMPGPELVVGLLERLARDRAPLARP
ncbi:MAG: glycosyltransferase [Acidimicrobiales bacterium]